MIDILPFDDLTLLLNWPALASSADHVVAFTVAESLLTLIIYCVCAIVLAAALVATAIGVKRRHHRHLRWEMIREELMMNLHDQIGGNLAVIALYVNELQDTQDWRPGEREAVFMKIREIIETTRESLPSIAYAPEDNRPLKSMIEDALSLVANSFEWTLDIQGSPSQFSPIIQHQLLQFVKEAAQNAVRHSGGDQLTVQIKADKRWFEIAVIDNGVWKQADEAGLGSSNLRKRAQLLGGKVDETRGTSDGEGSSIRLRTKTSNLLVRPDNRLSHGGSPRQ